MRQGILRIQAFQPRACHDAAGRTFQPSHIGKAPAAGALVASSRFSSLYVITRLAPFTLALVNTGAVASAFVTVSLELAASLPVASWMALASLPAVGSA